MINLEIARQDFGSIEAVFGALPPIGRRELVHLLATRENFGWRLGAREKVLEVAVVARCGGLPRRSCRIPTSHARIGGFVAWSHAAAARK
jgi:hypothetical protein